MHNINPLWHSFEASHPSDPVLSHFRPLVFFHLQSIFWLHFFKVRKGDYINLVMMNHPLSIQRSEKVEGLLLEIKSVAGWKQYITDTEGHKANHCFYTWVGGGGTKQNINSRTTFHTFCPRQTCWVYILCVSSCVLRPAVSPPLTQWCCSQ